MIVQKEQLYCYTKVKKGKTIARIKEEAVMVGLGLNILKWLVNHL